MEASPTNWNWKKIFKKKTSRKTRNRIRQKTNEIRTTKKSVNTTILCGIMRKQKHLWCFTTRLFVIPWYLNFSSFFNYTSWSKYSVWQSLNWYLKFWVNHQIIWQFGYKHQIPHWKTLFLILFCQIAAVSSNYFQNCLIKF